MAVGCGILLGELLINSVRKPLELRELDVAIKLVFDITSISSYTKNNAYVERGYNRDRENLKQINLGLLCSHSSNVPL